MTHCVQVSDAGLAEQRQEVVRALDCWQKSWRNGQGSNQNRTRAQGMMAAQGMAAWFVAAQGMASLADPDWTRHLESPHVVGHGVWRDHGREQPVDFGDQRQRRQCGAGRPRRQR